MYQIDSSGSVIAQPAPAAAGTPGWFTNGNPATGSPATILDGDWFNAVQAELVNVLAAAGITPTKGTNNQVLAALPTVIGNSQPSFMVNLNGANPSIPGSVWTKVPWNTKEFDTNNNFDSTTNFRFTPTVKGKYHLTATVDFSAGVAGNGLICAIYKNGSVYKQGPTMRFAAVAHQGAMVSAMADANGSSDYFELFVYQDTTSAQTINGSAAQTYFSGTRVGV